MPKASKPRSAPITADGNEMNALHSTTTRQSESVCERNETIGLSLGPLHYFWPAAQVRAFYASARDWPVELVYLGEVVCSKRRELRAADWLSLACQLREAGKQVVLSSLSLIEAESELSALKRLVENGEFMIEANDLSAVQLCRERRLPFVGGPTLNVYSQRSLAMLCEDGLRRWVPGVEQGEQQIADILSAARAESLPLPELEVQVWGRLPLAWSARCFTARAHNIGKDDCGFRCLEDEQGLPLATREGEALLRINGIQVQGAEVTDLGPQLPALRRLGARWLRILPHAFDLGPVVEHFALALSGAQPPPRLGAVNGYWQGQAGRPVTAA